MANILSYFFRSATAVRDVEKCTYVQYMEVTDTSNGVYMILECVHL